MRHFVTRNLISSYEALESQQLPKSSQCAAFKRWDLCPNWLAGGEEGFLDRGNPQSAAVLGFLPFGPQATSNFPTHPWPGSRLALWLTGLADSRGPGFSWVWGRQRLSVTECWTQSSRMSFEIDLTQCTLIPLCIDNMKMPFCCVFVFLDYAVLRCYEWNITNSRLCFCIINQI